METTRISPALIQGGPGGARTHAAHVAAAPVAPASRVRRKRAQVARACDGCRLQRIKCDNKFPCANCDARGRECSNSESARTSTLSQAHDEIVQLKQRVKDLEAELLAARAGSEPITTTTPPTTGRSTSLSPSQLRSAHLNNQNKIQSWAGVKLCPARAPNESWFGPSSLYFFLQRMNTSLITVLPQSLKPDRLFLASTTTKRLLDGPGAGSDPHGGDAIGSALNPTQEQYFIDLYWHSYHTTLLPVIDETEFKEHHQSLWAAGASTRKPSALVDIILALCMRLDFEAAPVDSTADVAAVPGRWHYRRCQALLAQELESPSISTLQCQMLSAIYLCGGSFHNMVDSAASALVRTAYILGLHVEPPAGTPRAEVEKRRRLWWTAYLLESMICIKLGRPFQSRDTHMMPSLPADDIEAAALSGSRFAPIGKDLSWLSFNLHHVKLHREVRIALQAFYERDLTDMLPAGRTMWDDPSVLESQAQHLLAHTQALDAWAAAVPPELKTKRTGGGASLSTDHTPLTLERFAPVWLQRQRLSLELAYHNWAVLLYRPFISFLGQPPAPGTAAHTLATRCANHAIALTRAHEQIVLNWSVVLDGSYELFHSQWSVAMTLVGFVLAYPDWTVTAAARTAIDAAVAVFDSYGKRMAAAANAAAIMRELCIKIDHVNGQRMQLDLGDDASGTVGPVPTAMLDASMSDMALADGTWGDGTGQSLFDMAAHIDLWDQADLMWQDYGMWPDFFMQGDGNPGPVI